MTTPGACPTGLPGVSQACQAFGGFVGGAVNRVAGFGADQVLNAISSWVGDAATWFVGRLGHLISSSTRPDLGAQWFGNHFRSMALVAAFVALPMLLVSMMRAIMRQDLSGLMRSAFVHLPLAILFTAVVVEVVQLCLAAVDALCDTVAASAGSDLSSSMATAVGSLSVPATGADPAVPAFVTFVAGLVVVFGAFSVWLELVVRSVAIYVTVLFLPLALVALVWPSTMHWSRRLAETLAALILAKLVIVTILSLALGAVSGEGKPPGFTGLIAGAALLLLAAFSPFVLLRLIPLVEAGAVSHLEGVSRRALHSVPVPSGSLSSLLMGAVSGGAGAGLEADGGEVARGYGIGMAGGGLSEEEALRRATEGGMEPGSDLLDRNRRDREGGGGGDSGGSGDGGSGSAVPPRPGLPSGSGGSGSVGSGPAVEHFASSGSGDRVGSVHSVAMATKGALRHAIGDGRLSEGGSGEGSDS